MVVFALILLFFANNQSPAILFDTAGTEAATGGNYLPAFALGMFMALFVVYGFDTAGTFGEETVDPGRQAPRGVIWSVIISGIVGTIFLLAVLLAIPDVPTRDGPVLPDRRHDHRDPDAGDRRPGSRSARCISS